MKTIATINKLASLAEARACYNMRIGEASVNRRARHYNWGGGVTVGELREVYRVAFLKGTEASVAELHHYGTLTAKVVNNHDGGGWYLAKVYGESRSDADSVNTFLSHFNISRQFTYRPVNGGFMEVN